MSAGTRSAPLDRLLRPLHKWVWSDHDRRVRKLLIFGDVETDGGRDILRASEVTPDPLLRRLYLEHAIDELHHGVLFRERGEALLRQQGLREGLYSAASPVSPGVSWARVRQSVSMSDRRPPVARTRPISRTARSGSRA